MVLIRKTTAATIGRVTASPNPPYYSLNGLRDLWGERLSSSTFGHRQRGAGDYAALLGQRFDIACCRHGLGEVPALDTRAFRPPAGGQIGLRF